MSSAKILKKYRVPEDAVGTCGIQSLRAKYVSYLDNPRYAAQVPSNTGGYVLVSPALIDIVRSVPGNTYIQTENPTQAFLEIHNDMHRHVRSLTSGSGKPTQGTKCEIDPTAKFGAHVVLGNRVRIHPHVVIGTDVEIGDDTEILAGTVVYDRVRMGKRCIIDANASIGGDGYRIMADAEGRIHRLIHIGGVRFGDDVEFGNSSCVDRGTFEDTILEDRVKVDNLVHVGHNAHIKENTQLAASSCIGGSTVIGRNCWVGIGATISNGLTVGDNASVLINAVVTKDVPDGAKVAGFYAIPNDAWRLVVKDNVRRFVTEATDTEAKGSESGERRK
jgi:UDP-3-O-[3-hydroxymyristoyl] glucosamine N-acyltransferase